MLKLSDHFRDNWRIRVGNEPNPKAVKAIINESVLLQQGKRLRKLNGEPYNTHSLYWHADLSMVIRVDWFSLTAVSVLSEKCMPKPKRGIKADRRMNTAPSNCRNQAYYTPMTMHR